MESNKLEKPRKNGTFSTLRGVMNPHEEDRGVFPHDEATRLRTRCGTRDCGFFISQKERFYTSFTPVGSTNDAILHLILHQFIKSLLNEIAPTAVELWAQFFAFLRIFIQESSRNRYVLN